MSPQEIDSLERLASKGESIPNAMVLALLDEIRRLQKASGERGSLRYYQEEAL